MPTQALPENPSLDNLKKQAKSLKKAYLASDPDAFARVREFHPHANQALQNFTLTDAQLVLARNYGFPSWSKLKQHLEEVRRHYWLPPDESSTSDSEPIEDRFVRLACLNYRSDHWKRQEEARKLLVTNPLLSRHSIYTAAVVGDTAAAREMLASNPKLAKQRGGPNRWEPMLYAAYSRLNSQAEGHSTLEVVRLLLAHGADPNAGFLWDGRYIFTALTGAFGEGESGPVHQPPHQYCDQLARLLLESGADPNDSQTLYNRMFTGAVHHLELLSEFGLGKGGDGPWFKRLGAALATPAQMLQQQIAWAAKYHQMERLRWLVEHGVDVNKRDTRFHRTPYELALLNGDRDIAQYLLEHGAKPVLLDDSDAFAAACFTADADAARQLLAKDPSVLDRLGQRRVELLNRAAEEDRREAVRLMAELGFNVNEVQGTAPIHLAAAGDHVEMIKLLIELGADPLIRDTNYNSTPLGWAKYNDRQAAAKFLESIQQKT